MQEFLEVLRVQRHDFMNHLQVISGLLQLKQYERAAEYIRRAAEDVHKKSMITRLGTPELAMAVLLAELAAAKEGISLSTWVDPEIPSGTAIPLTAVSSVRSLLDLAIELAQNASSARAEVEAEICCQPFGLLFRVHYRSGPETRAGRTAATSLLEKAASEAGCRLSVSQAQDGRTVCTLEIPLAQGAEKL